MFRYLRNLMTIRHLEKCSVRNKTSVENAPKDSLLSRTGQKKIQENNTKLNFILGQCVLAEIQYEPLCGWLW